MDRTRVHLGWSARGRWNSGSSLIPHVPADTGGGERLEETTAALRSGDGSEGVLLVKVRGMDDTAVVVLAHAGFAEVKVTADLALQTKGRRRQHNVPSGATDEREPCI